MWLIAVAVLMNLIGFVTAAAVLVLVSREKAGWGEWSRTRRGQGTLALLAGAFALAAGGQYKLFGAIYSVVRNPHVEPELGTVVLGVFAAGVVLLALGTWMLYQGREQALAGPAAPPGPAVPQGAALVTAVAGLTLALVGLNLYQWFTRPLTDQEIADRYHQWFYNNIEKTWANSSWLGVTALQNPNDIWIHQEIIAEVKPDFIIEAGTARGGSALLWAMVLQQVNPKGKVITLDIEDATEDARKLPVWEERVEFIKGSSTDPQVVAELTKRVKGHKVLVILDSDHSKKHVLEELKAYSPLVPVGSYLIVQDTNINGHPVLKEFGPGPMEAVNEFLATNKDFEPDRSRERFLFTMHPKGYLKRIK